MHSRSRACVAFTDRGVLHKKEKLQLYGEEET
jgi:hypothetical protein